MGEPISALMRPGNTAPFEEMSRGGEPLTALSDLRAPRFEPQTSRSRDERVTAQTTSHIIKLAFNKSVVFETLFKFSKNHFSFSNSRNTLFDILLQQITT